MASKSSDVRPKITLACTECKERNYITKKNRRNDPDRMELKKFCPRCRKHTAAPRDPLSPAPHHSPTTALRARPVIRAGVVRLRGASALLAFRAWQSTHPWPAAPSRRPRRTT